MEKKHEIDLGGRILEVVDIIEMTDNSTEWMYLLLDFKVSTAELFRLGETYINNEMYFIEQIRKTDILPCFEVICRKI